MAIPRCLVRFLPAGRNDMGDSSRNDVRAVLDTLLAAIATGASLLTEPAIR
ncbi:MAG: hypothetical protein V1897_05115 [Pseudomonadota bacterium]